MKNLKELAKLVTELEGKKKSVNIAQVLEMLKIVSTLIKQDYRVLKVLLK